MTSSHTTLKRRFIIELATPNPECSGLIFQTKSLVCCYLQSLIAWYIQRLNKWSEPISVKISNEMFRDNTHSTAVEVVLEVDFAYLEEYGSAGKGGATVLDKQGQELCYRCLCANLCGRLACSSEEP